MRECPTELELDRALLNADVEVAAHVAGCVRCSTFWEVTAQAITLARDLPSELPPAMRREDLRSAILAASDGNPTRAHGRGWRIPALAVAAAAVVSLFVVTRSRPSPAPAVSPVGTLSVNRGTVHAHAGATYTLTSDSPDEIVRLRDGTIDVDVRPLQHGQRFRVVIGPDEVEVRGTSFEVVAAADHLVGVHVVHGRVEVRHLGAAPVVLAPGESWHPTETAVVPLPLPSPSSVSPPPRSVPRKSATKASLVEPPRTPVARAARATDPQEVAFVSGWEAMRRNDYRSAAAAFAKVVALDPTSSLAEDGAFWRGASLAQMRHTAEAISALREFIEDHGSSARVREASAMLGWLLLDANEVDEARRRFEAAASDPDPAVQGSARKGLEALQRRSH